MGIIEQRAAWMEQYAREYLKDTMRDVYLGKLDVAKVFPACKVLQKHDDGDYTLECSEAGVPPEQYVVTREGQTFISWNPSYFLSSTNMSVEKALWERVKAEEERASQIKAANG